MKKELLFKTVRDVNFYVDKNDREMYYVEFKDSNNNVEFDMLDSEKFKGFLYLKSYEITDGQYTLEPNKAITHLRYILAYQKSCNEITVYRRIAGSLDRSLEYDLQNDKNESIKVTRNGWYISKKRNRFLVPSISIPQKTPIQTNKSPLELLKPFVNISGDSYTLFVIWLIQEFSRGSHYALLISADKGSGKTTLSKLIKRIIDPCKFTVSTIPERNSDLYVLLYNSFLCCFDNIRTISDDQSDIFCGAVTGSSVVKRSLYTNGELLVCQLHNIIVFNGIDVMPKRDDLAERILYVKLNKLQPQELKRDKTIEDSFEKALPEIIGSIFNTLSTAINQMKNSREENLERMADSFMEMIAIAKALGIDERTFRRMYSANKNELDMARCTSPLLEAIKEYFSTQKTRKIADKAEKLLEKVRANYSGDKSLLPASASQFSQKLEKEHDSLFKAGYRVNIDDTSSVGTEIAIIKKKKVRS